MLMRRCVGHPELPFDIFLMPLVMTRRSVAKGPEALEEPGGTPLDVTF